MNPVGLAASALGGTTLNAFAGVGRAEGGLAAMQRSASRPEAAQRWRRATALIIDEARTRLRGSPLGVGARWALAHPSCMPSGLRLIWTALRQHCAALGLMIMLPAVLGDSGEGPWRLAQCNASLSLVKALWRPEQVSMVGAELFEQLEAVARHVRRSDSPFGGLQLVLAGDFHQLPPVAKGRAALAGARRRVLSGLRCTELALVPHAMYKSRQLDVAASCFLIWR